MPQLSKPKLTNRGPAGLLNKKPTGVPETKQVEVPEAPINKILANAVVVDIDTLVLDPNNARLHPERNMEAIKDSLRLYGQTKPIVVRKGTNVVVAGNGTLEGAKALGWTKIAASLIDFDDVQAAGYGLADNRTAELAKWDFEIVARLDKLLLEAGHATVGWSLDELEVLRAADWTPPPLSDGFGDGAAEEDPLITSFTPDQHEIIDKAVKKMREAQNNAELDQAECLVLICDEWFNKE